MVAIVILVLLYLAFCTLHCRSHNIWQSFSSMSSGNLLAMPHHYHVLVVESMKQQQMRYVRDEVHIIHLCKWSLSLCHLKIQLIVAVLQTSWVFFCCMSSCGLCLTEFLVMSSLSAWVLRCRRLGHFITLHKILTNIEIWLCHTHRKKSQIITLKD